MARKKKEPKIEFKDKTEAEIAKEQFKQLLNTPAWKRLVEFFDGKIEYHKDELVNKSINDLDELERIRDKIKLITQFRNLPEILSTQADMAEGKEIEFDPFA